ncbi:MAG: translocation/assembly module TamB domain-containing protein [Pseudomonadota bacterium]
MPWPRWLLRSALALGGLVLLVALALVAAWQALRTETGTAWLLSQVSGLKITGGRGSIEGGPFAAAKVEFQLEDGPVHLVIDGLAWRDLRWQWRPYPGSWTGLRIEGLRAQRVQIRTRPGRDEPAAPPPQALRMLFELVLADARVQALHVNDLPPLLNLRTDLHLGADHGRAHRLQTLSFAWDRLQLQAQAELQADAPLAVKAQAQLRSQPLPGATGPMATAWQAQVQAGGTLPRLALDAQLRAAPGPQAPAASLDLHGVVAPFAAWPLAELRAQVKSLDLAALASAAPATRIDGQAVIDTTGLDRPAQVDLQLRNALPGRWDEGRLPLRTLDLKLQGRPDQHDRLELQAFDAALGNGEQAAGRLGGSGAWHGDALTLRATVRSLKPSELDRRLAAMDFSGPVELSLNRQAAPEGGWSAALKTTLDGRLPLKNAPPVRLQLQADAASGRDSLRWSLQKLEAAAGAARATAQASGQRDAAGRWQIDSRGELSDFDPLPWWPGAPGSAWRQGGHRLNGRWELSLGLPAAPAAPVANPLQRWAGTQGRAELQLRDSRLAGVPLQAELRASADGRSPLARLAAELQAAGNQFQIEGQLALSRDGRADRWKLQSQAGALAALAPIGRLVPALAGREPSAGSLTLQAEAQGRWPALAGHGEARLTALKAGTLQVENAQARWRFGGGPDAPLELNARAEGLAQGAQRVERLHAELSGTLRAHRLQLQADTAARPPAWTDPLLDTGAGKGTRFVLAGDGAWEPGRDGGRWTGRVARLRAGPTGAPNAAWLVGDGLQLEVALDASMTPQGVSAQPGALTLLGASLRWRQARWQAGGDGLPRIDLQAQLEPLSVAPLLARLQPHFGWGGDLRVAGQVNVSTGASFNADVVLQRVSGDLRVTDEGGTQSLGLTDLRLALAAHEGVWHFTEAVAGTTLGVLAGAQSMRVGPRAVWPSPDTPMEGVLELRVDNLGVWGPWTPAGWRLSGQLHTSAWLGGRFGAPEYTGRLEGRGIGARNLLQGVNVTDGELRIALKGPVAQIERFVLKGGDGELQLQGSASFGDTPRAQLQLVASKFQLLGRVDRRIVTSGRGELSLEEEAVRFDGRFVVDEGLIDFSRSDAPTLDDDVVVVRNGRAAAGDTPDTATPPKPPRRVQASVQVDLGQRLRLRGRGLDTTLQGDLRLTTPGGRLAVNGTVRAEDGTYQAYGQKLEIERGLVTFVGPVENPRLDIVALRPNLDVRVGVSVGGTALAPRVRLFSDPEMSDADKLSWLVLGRAPEGLGRADTALLQHAAMALLSGEGESTTDKVLRTLGLDDFSVRQEGEGELRQTVVSLGKQLSRRWYVGYERGVNSTVGNWQLIYRLAQRLTLRAQSGEDNALDVIWTWRWN